MRINPILHQLNAIIQRGWKAKRNAYDWTLYFFVASRGRVAMTTAELAEECTMSAGQVHKSRTWLMDNRLIKGKKVRAKKRRGQPRWELTLNTEFLRQKGN